MGQDSDDPKSHAEDAAKHVADAHGILKTLRAELSEHPQVEEAILKLEMALSILTTKSGGML